MVDKIPSFTEGPTPATGASRLVGVVTDLPHGRPVAVLPDGRVIGSVTGPPLPE